jgi:uncharacterized delta-60 repeat protein
MNSCRPSPRTTGSRRDPCASSAAALPSRIRGWCPGSCPARLLLLVFLMLFGGGERLRAATTPTHLWCVLSDVSNPSLRINLAAGESLQVPLPAGTYAVEMGGDGRVWADGNVGFASVGAWMRFRMYLGGEATDFYCMGSANGAADAYPSYESLNEQFDSRHGTYVASVQANGSGVQDGCGGIRTDASASSLAAGYADSTVITGVVEFQAWAEYAPYGCGLGHAESQIGARFYALFTLPSATGVTIVTDTPPPSDGGGGVGPMPTLPDASTPAAPGDCGGQPTYAFHNAASGGWFAVPASGSALRFDALGATRFTGVTGFPTGQFHVETSAQSYGPFIPGQSCSFTNDASGSVTGFTVRAAAGQIPTLAAFQLGFESATGDFQGRVAGPADARVDCERVSAGQPPTQTSPLAVARGEAIRFAARVPGTCTHTYQWRRNGVALPGETGATLTLTGVGAEHFGAYSVVVHDELGTAESPALVIEPLLYTLTVNAVGGTVTRSPDLAGYEPGTVVTLQAVPAAGFAFVGWDGDAQGTANPVEVAVTRNATVTGLFGNPFGGTPRTIPGRIEAEDFDEGGEGAAYHDTSAENQGGSAYRTGGVDVKESAGRKEVGWSDNGEWLNYTVNVPAAGLYRAVFRVSSGMSGGTGQLRFSGGPTTGPVAVPGTGAWGTFVDVSSEPFSLPAGVQVMRFEYVQAGFDLDWIDLHRVNSPPVADAGGPYTIIQGGNLFLDGSGSFEPDAANGDYIISYWWDLNDDGQFSDAGGATPTVSSSQLSALGLGAGTHTIRLRVFDLFGLTGNASSTLTIRGTQTITFDPIAGHVLGDAPFTINATASSGLPVTLTSLTPGVATVSGNTVTLMAAGTATLRASQAGDANYAPAADVERTLTVAKATPVITWATPADITLGTALSEAQLNATANVPGTFTYDPPAGTVLYSGDGRLLTARFTPGEIANFGSATATITINVLFEGVPELWTWGWGYMGQLGNGTSGGGIQQTTPAPVSVPPAWMGRSTIGIASYGHHSLALFDDGSLWTWGVYGTGSLGSNAPRSVSRPASWAGRTVVKMAAGLNHNLVVLDDGTVWAWGAGQDGALGDGRDGLSVSIQPAPVAAPAGWTGKSVVGIAAGGSHSLALLNDGTVWAWGSGGHGQLGNGQSASSVPVAVVRPAAWTGRRVIEVAAGEYHSAVLLDDGAVWTWGGNFAGALGNGQGADSPEPIPVLAPAAWSGHPVVRIVSGTYFNLALLEDGSLWAWGHGDDGQLGDGNTRSSSVPVAVAAPTGWSGRSIVALAAGMVHSAIALDDGSLWVWGNDGYGQLGNGPTGDSSVPVLVSAPVAWASKKVPALAAGYFHTLATVHDPNEPPVAGDDTYSVAEDTTLTVEAPGLLANDSDTESGALTIATATPPAHGALTLRTDGSFDYTPAANYHGGDSFAYTVSDSGGLTATATVNLTVTPVNDPPQITSQHVSTLEDTALAVILGAADLDGDAVTLSVISAPAHGTVSGTPPELTYTPHANYHGSDSFGFLANDGHGGIGSATVFITVTPANDAPVDRDRSVSVLEDRGGGQVQPQVDVDGEAVTYFVVAPPQHGRVEPQSGNLIYFPNANYNGPDSYTFKATDGTLESPLYTYTINVIPVNDAPVAAAAIAHQAGAVGNAFSLTLAADTFTDVDAGTVFTYSVAGLPAGLGFDPATGLIAGTPAVAGTFTVTVTATDEGLPPLSASTTFALEVAKGTPVITWATPADINCQTALGPTQLNATANTEGTLAYNPPAGSILSQGEGHVLSFSFTPADPANWDPASATTTIGVRLHPGAPLGQLDPAFDAGAVGYQLRMITVQPDGKALICGWFTSFHGVSRNEIARLNADGSLDLDFDPGSGLTGGRVDAVALQADGKVLVSGDFSEINGMSRRGVARFHQDGTLDSGFSPGTGANSRVHSVAVQSDGRVLIGGWFTSVNGVSRNRIARLNSDGSVDTSFDPGAGPVWSNDNYVRCVAVQPDEKILIVGSFTTVNGVSRNRIARLHPDGSLDAGFDVGTGANQDVYAVAVQSEGKVLVGGVFTSINGLSRSRLARLNEDGSVDTGFSPTVAGPVFSVVTQPDGRTLIGGNMGSVNGVPRMRVARLLADGTVDPSFDPLAGARQPGSDPGAAARWQAAHRR